MATMAASNQQVSDDGHRREDGSLQLRLDDPLNDSTRIAHRLFGADVGRCYGDFSCSHTKIRGRLYATSNAILYYSVLLGFERRIYLHYQDIIGMDLFRTTSIRLQTTEDETYVFKSFEDRQKVLRLLKSLEMIAVTNSASSSFAESVHRDSQIDDSLFESEPPLERHQSTPIDSSPASPRRSYSSKTLSISSKPTLGNRRRSVSDSLMTSSGVSFGTSPPRQAEPSALHQSVHGSTDIPIAPLILSTESERQSLSWDQVKVERPLREQAVESLIIACSVSQFFQTFLADDATYSLVHHQSDHVHDKDVQATPWKRAGSAMTRTITFTHPIKSSMGLGPSEARTTRQQRLEKFDHVGILLENVTTVGGIPAADTFEMRDCWLLEQLEDDQTKLSSSFQVHFTKRSIFRGIIEKNIRKETLDWWSGYSEMLQKMFQDQLGSRAPEDSQSPVLGDQILLRLQKSMQSTVRLLALAVIILVLVLIVLCVQLALLQQELSSLKNSFAAPLAVNDQCPLARLRTVE